MLKFQLSKKKGGEKKKKMDVNPTIRNSMTSQEGILMYVFHCRVSEKQTHNLADLLYISSCIISGNTKSMKTILQ